MMRSTLKLSFVAAVLCMVAMQSVYPQAAMISPDSPEAQALVERVQRTGLIQIIVQLNVAVKLESDLPPAARDAQRDRISAAQTRLLRRIGPAGIRSVTRYQYVPLIAMTVEARALEALLSSPEVMAVQESVPEPPALANSVPADQWG
jgi:hypothetical protein